MEKSLNIPNADHKVIRRADNATAKSTPRHRGNRSRNCTEYIDR
jgi:hypothetical protein